MSPKSSNSSGGSQHNPKGNKQMELVFVSFEQELSILFTIEFTSNST